MGIDALACALERFARVRLDLDQAGRDAGPTA